MTELKIRIDGKKTTVQVDRKIVCIKTHFFSKHLQHLPTLIEYYKKAFNKLLIVNAKIKKEDVFALINRNKEYEIIIIPKY